MANDYTRFCESKLLTCLRSKCPVFEWSQQEGISHKDLQAWIDICGKSNGNIVLIQFEMHKIAALTNAIKTAYCLERRPYQDKKVLMLHVFSPFSEKPEEIREIQDNEFPSSFLKKMKKKETRATDRRTAYDVRLLCKFLEFKGLLNSEIMTYRVLTWYPIDLQVHEATIVFPRDESEFPQGTSDEITNLAEQIKTAISEWQEGALS